MKRLIGALTMLLAAAAKLHAVAVPHVTLVSSQPAANAVLASAPASIRLEFSEIVEPPVAHVMLVDPSGRSTALSLSNDPHDAHVILAAVPRIGVSGTFRVEWHVLSEDGHPVTASFLFTVGAATSPPPVGGAAAQPAAWGPAIAGAPLIPSVLRGLGVGSLAALAGLLFFAFTTGAAIDSRPMRVALMFSVAAPLLLVAHLVAWLINGSPTHAIDGAWVTSAFATEVGRIELWRTVLSVLPVWALVLVRRARLALALASVALFFSAAVGHSAAFLPMWSIPLKALHLLALSSWLGGLLWIVVAERDSASAFADQALGVSSIALWSVVVITLSGIAQTALLLQSVAALNSAYGAVVLAKVAGLAILVAFGAYHRYRIVPKLGVDRGGVIATSFRASVQREVAVMWLVVLLGGFLGYVSPPSSQPSPSTAQATNSSP